MRLAVNAVTLGDFEQPIKISLFVKDLFAGFSMVCSMVISPLDVVAHTPHSSISRMIRFDVDTTV